MDGQDDTKVPAADPATPAGDAPAGGWTPNPAAPTGDDTPAAPAGDAPAWTPPAGDAPATPAGDAPADDHGGTGSV